MMIGHKRLLWLWLWLSLPLSAAEIIVSDIEVQGLQGLTPGAFFSYLPLRVGQTFATENSAALLRTLYATGFFEDIQLELGEVVDNRAPLRFIVKTRPVITELRLSGNKVLKKEDLAKALEQLDLVEGRIFNPGKLTLLAVELERTYFALGKYDVKITTSTEKVADNLLVVTIDIQEGPTSEIAALRFFGNQAFDDSQLRRLFQTGRRGFLGLFSNKQYAKAQLDADLEKLRSFYLDRGYLTFKIKNAQVSVVPDKSRLFIDIYLEEGQVYQIGAIRLAGEKILSEAELLPAITVASGETFSRRKIIESSNALRKKLADIGYAFAQVEVLPDFVAENRADLTFNIDPGQRIYVRRINFFGNTNTEDRTLRRELRQMESAWYEQEAIDRSKLRLEQLGFVGNVRVEPVPVPDKNDQVDLNIQVEEQFSGSFVATAGYSQSQGVLLGISINQNNFLGTGKRLSLTADNSTSRKNFSLSYLDPYFTLEGQSLGVRAFYSKIDARKEDIDNYLADLSGFGLQYGIPLSDFSRFTLTADYQNTRIRTGSNTAQSTLDFIQKYGSRYNTYSLGALLTLDRRNRAIFPDKGAFYRLGADVALPFGDLSYYRLNAEGRYYFRLAENTSLSLRAEIGYGKGYGKTDSLPFYERYFAGGIGSVRGYRSSSLGPRDALTGDPIGGDFRLISSAELILPTRIFSEGQNARLSLFLDAGNVFADYDRFDAAALRLSAGVGLVWITPIGILRFSLAEALNAKAGDKRESFQFSLGSGF
jgi:outer membrane protein insertion porin family